MAGIEFVVAAYALTWVVLAVYGAYVWRRFRRAERAVNAEERLAVAPEARARETRVGGAA